MPLQLGPKEPRLRLETNVQPEDRAGSVDSAIESVTEPQTRSPSQGKVVIDVICLHADDTVGVGHKAFDANVVCNLANDMIKLAMQIPQCDVRWAACLLDKTIQCNRFVLTTREALRNWVTLSLTESERMPNFDPGMHSQYRSGLGRLK